MTPMQTQEQQEAEIRRIRSPKPGEQLGIVIAMLGSNRVTVECDDGETRMGRIRGKIRKRVWIREGDLVIIVPWEIEPAKCDVMWRYTRTQANYLKRKGFGKNLNF